MREPIFSVTKDDIEFQTFRCGGHGGQNMQKNETGVRAIHRPSGAIGESREERSQLQNKRTAFRRMAETKKFQVWIRLQSMARLKGIQDLDKLIERQLKKENLKIEFYTPKV